MASRSDLDIKTRTKGTATDPHSQASTAHSESAQKPPPCSVSVVPLNQGNRNILFWRSRPTIERYNAAKRKGVPGSKARKAACANADDDEDEEEENKEEEEDDEDDEDDDDDDLDQIEQEDDEEEGDEMDG